MISSMYLISSPSADHGQGMFSYKYSIRETANIVSVLSDDDFFEDND